MKKRSLVAALAMLVVSAIVLTSSTYAWFAVSDSAEVTTISAQVTNASGALTLKAKYNAKEGAVEKTVLMDSDFNLVTNLSPVSMYLNNQGVASAYFLNYEGSTFLPGGVATGKYGETNALYQHYSFDVNFVNGSADAAETITMKPNFNSANNYCYGLVIVSQDGVSSKETRYLFTPDGATYAPVTGLSGNVEDSNQAENCSYVIDSGDKNYANAAMPTDMASNYTIGANDTAVDIMTVAGGEQGKVTVEVIIWAEGQDPQCVTGAVTGAASFGFEFGM